jgi:hypothetical protein
MLRIRFMLPRGVEDMKTGIRDVATTIDTFWVTHGKKWNFIWMFSV